MKVLVKLQTDQVIEFIKTYQMLYGKFLLRLQPIEYVNAKNFREELQLFELKKKQKSYTLKMDINHFDLLRNLYLIDSESFTTPEYSYKRTVITFILEEGRKQLEQFIQTEISALTKDLRIF